MTGLPMPPGSNVQFLAPGAGSAPGLSRVEWYSTASQSTQAIGGIPDLPVYRFTRVPGGWSVALLLVAFTCPPHCWNGQYFVADGSAQATKIGTGFELLASDRPGEVWLLSYPRTMVSTAKASATIQLFSTTGQALGQSYRLPAGYLLVRGVGRYLLLSRRWWTGSTTNDVPYSAVLWDPRSKRIVGRFPSVVDAGPDEVAWSPQCRGCHVRLLNVLTGKSVMTPVPGGQSAGLDGTFTDDATLLAVRLRSGQLAVYDTGSRALTVIPGTALSDKNWQTFGWLNGSHMLVVTSVPGGRAGPRQLAYWQPGDARLRIATVTNPSEIGAMQGWAS